MGKICVEYVWLGGKNELRAKTEAFKQRVANGETLDAILPEAFALVREAARRTLGQRHYDVQLIGGIALHRGNIAEMRTGEGKTLVATLPTYLNALAGKGVHVVTVNDYLVQRDRDWTSPFFRGLGLTVIAEGIETEAEMAAMQKAGATHLQGYLFSRALPADHIEAIAATFGATSAATPARKTAARRPRALS